MRIKLKLKLAKLSRNANGKKIGSIFQGNLVIILLTFVGLYFPNQPGFDDKFFIQFLAGSKKVIHIKFIL